MYNNMETGRLELMEMLDFRPSTRKDGSTKQGRDILNFVQSPSDFTKFLSIISRFHKAVQDLPKVYNISMGLFKLDFTKLTLNGIRECLIPIIPIEARKLYLKFRAVPEFCTMEEPTQLEQHFPTDARVKVIYLTRLQTVTQQKQLANIKEKKSNRTIRSVLILKWFCIVHYFFLERDLKTLFRRGGRTKSPKKSSELDDPVVAQEFKEFLEAKKAKLLANAAVAEMVFNREAGTSQQNDDPFGGLSYFLYGQTGTGHLLFDSHICKRWCRRLAV